MAHGITSRDDLMYVGQTPWHGLGHRLDAAWFGTGKMLKQGAWNELQEFARVN